MPIGQECTNTTSQNTVMSVSSQKQSRMSHKLYPLIWYHVFTANPGNFSLVKQQKTNGCMKAKLNTNGNGFNN